MADTQLGLDVDLEVANHHDAALGPDRPAASAELSGLHVALEDVDAFLLVEGDTGYLIETDDVVLGDQPSAAGVHVHEHVGNRGLAARHQVSVRRDLLEQVRFTGATRPKLDGVVVADDKGDHPGDQNVLLATVKRLGSNPTLRNRSSRH